MVIAFFTYNDVSKYFEKHWLLAIITVGIVFFLLGWIISRIMRPNTYVVEEAIRNSKKALIDELKTSRKFNADYKLFSEKGKEEQREEEAIN